MFGRLRIRGKLVLVVGLPLLAVALLTLPSVFSAVDRWQRAEDIDYSMRVAHRVTGLAFELQQERLVALGYLFDVVDRGELVTEAARVDDRVVEIHDAVERGELRERGLPERVSAAVTATENLADRRESILDRSVQAEQVFFEYSQVIGELIDSLALLDGADLATTAAHHVAVLEASLDMNEASAQASTLLLIIAATRSPFAGVQYAVALQPIGEAFDQYLRYATRDQLLLRDQMEQAYIARDATGEGVALAFDPYEVTADQSPAELFPHVQSLGQLGHFVEGKIIADVLIEVDSQREAALRNAYLIALGALLVVLVVVTATAVLTRRVVRPLLSLTDSANRVARLADAELARIADDESVIRLTEPIRIDPVHVRARDEIGDLGRAFERVQQFAIQLVERQMISRRNVALMFGYLGRRTQNLVGRQLDLLDDLERNETDADRLADLYRLDHVSSRLRRNAGSLVVLSGAPGQDEYTAPLPLADIVRLALGEIEDYERVDIDVPPAITVTPAVIGDLVLVLAELMENATTFSPPHSRVTVSAVATGQSGPADRVVEILVIDHGIGIPPDRMAEENARLARRERLDLAPTEVLGLFVVGRLARRHGLLVSLSETAGGGVTALVGLYRRHVLPGEARLVRSGRTGGVGSPDSAQRKLAEVPGGGRKPGAFDAEALERATRMLESAQPWDAFGTPPAEPGAPSAVPTADPPGDLPAADPPGVPAADPPPVTRAVGSVAAPPPPPPPPSSDGLAGLRRRVPGASLEPPVTAARPRPDQNAANPGLGGRAAALDPDLARELVEQLQTGVRRALSEIKSDDGLRGERDDT